MKNRSFLAVIALTTFVLAPTAFAGSPDGAALYKSKCAICHGADGAGQTAMGKNMKLRDLRSAEVQKQTDAALNTVIADGKGKMPGYKAKMTAADIQAMVTFIRSIKK